MSQRQESLKEVAEDRVASALAYENGLGMPYDVLEDAAWGHEPGAGTFQHVSPGMCVTLRRLSKQGGEARLAFGNEDVASKAWSVVGDNNT